jgi:hypothetical protein
VNKLERKIQAIQKLFGGGHNVGHARKRSVVINSISRFPHAFKFRGKVGKCEGREFCGENAPVFLN